MTIIKLFNLCIILNYYYTYMVFIRKLLMTDDFNHYKQLINQMSNTEFNHDEFIDLIKNLNKNHQIWVMEHEEKGIIGTGSMIIEQKFLHNMGKVAHIEDIIIDNSCRGEGYGKMIIKSLVEKANEYGCYKVILNCNDKLVPFYEKLGFENKNNQMAIYFGRASRCIFGIFVRSS